MRRLLVLVSLVLALTASLLTAGTGAGAQTAPGAPAPAAVTATQQVIFDHLGTAQKDKHYRPVVTQPANYVAPLNLRDGNAYLRLVVSGKPSTKQLGFHVCMWRHNGLLRFFWETCSAWQKATVTTDGTYFVNLGPVGTWWKKNGVWDWTKPASDIRLMLMDPATRTLMYVNSCGTHCYGGTNIDQHLPFTVKSEFVLVGQGRNLVPPASWVGKCPKTWPGC